MERSGTSYIGSHGVEEKKRLEIVIERWAGRYTQQTTGQLRHTQASPTKFQTPSMAPLTQKSPANTLIHILLQTTVSISEMGIIDLCLPELSQIMFTSN